jgi:DNA-binding transcriptional LysR family regulator
MVVTMAKMHAYREEGTASEELTIRSLRYFQQLASDGQFEKTAGVFGITVPALRNHLKLLTDRYGPLWERTGRGVRLTATGQHLLTQVNSIILSIDEIDTVMDAYRSGGLGTVRIGASLTFAEQVLPGAVASYLPAHPHVKIHLEVGNSVKLLDALNAHRLDFAIVGKLPEGRMADGGIYSVNPFRSDQIVAFVSQQRPPMALRRIDVRAPLDPALLRDQTFVTRERESGNYERAMAHLESSGCEPGRVISLASNGAVRNLVASGVGIGLLSDLAVRGANRQGVQLLTLNPWDGARMNYLVARKGKPRSKTEQDFLHELGVDPTLAYRPVWP